MSGSDTRMRRRGVRASRARLEQALAETGLRTQAALAERIADLEGLDAAPKDLVSRVFRERPVDPQTLERVARALGVPAHTLYRTSAEARPSAAGPAAGPGIPRRLPALLAVAALAVSLFAAGLAAWRWSADGTGPAAPPPSEAVAPAPAGPVSVAVLPIEGDEDGALAQALRGALAPGFRLTSPASVLVAADEGPARTAERLRVDGVVDGRARVQGRYVGAEIFLFHDGRRRLAWSDAVPRNAWPRRLDRFASDAAEAVGVALGREGARPRHHPSSDALEDFLAGWAHLDRSRTELNVKRALTRFESALRRSPDYPAAHAGLCEALVQQSILSRETRFLEDAEQQCLRALQIDPRRIEALTAWGNVLRKTGRIDPAADAFGRALDLWPGHTDALLGLAEVALARYRADPAEANARAAVDYARRAVESDPGFWKPPYVLGRALYFTGDVDGAVEAVARARALDANEHVLSNLGTFQFCRGDHEAALESYLQVKQAAPRFYVGDVHLGVVHYFLGHYDEAAALFEAALETARQDGRPEDHRVWANLADARRHAGEREPAQRAYEQAATLAERDLARGDNPENTRAYLAYYYTALLALDPAGASPAARAAVDRQIAAARDNATDAEALTRLAEALVLRGETDGARALYDRITAQCEGFGASPDLAALR